MFETNYRTAAATGRPSTFEAAYPGARDGWFEIRVWPGSDGLAIYVLDVTDRRDAEDAARRATARASLLARVTAELSGQLDTLSALGRLAELVVPVLADACIVTLVDREGRASDVGSWHGDPARRRMIQRYAQIRLDTLPGTSPVAQALREGTPVTESVGAVLDLMEDGPARDLLARLAPVTAVALPLTAEARTVGVLTLYQDAGRVMSDEDMDTARQVTAEAARAIVRVHRQSQQAQLAEALQRSLLTDPPALEETAVVVRYVPAAEAASVGGDWYDAFLQRDGSLMVVIGDVVGHDTAAAAAMGQLRGLLRGSRTTAAGARRGPARAGRGHRPDARRDVRDGGRRAVRARRERARRAALGQRRPPAADRARRRRHGDDPRRGDRRSDARRRRRRRPDGVDDAAPGRRHRAAPHRRPGGASREQPRRGQRGARRAPAGARRHTARGAVRRRPAPDAARHPAGRRRAGGRPAGPAHPDGAGSPPPQG
ncbi:GAF domain-containing protein [Blastococcus brunescens]|uniref:GAF domain-containing protein n=1 Tax=Blastococcus brunescens TaxID=1564165 RepID=A0ABZ1AZY3_9ACTN|nr:GAF domain-containing protein [Blastococcus sp. BMG 8361]WRL63692.1 GAF domain-containing protein [Blastococcus sp. BMG 8361]